MIAKFKIDSEFRSLLIPLSKDEADQLEKNVLNAGTILEPLVVWQQQEILLDGHHRYDLAMKHGLTFNVAAISLLDRDAAIQWIIDNQLGHGILRRNRRAICGDRSTPAEKQPTATTAGFRRIPPQAVKMTPWDKRP